MRAEDYRLIVQYSPEDGEYVASVREFPSLSWLDTSQRRASQGMLRLLDEVLADMKDSGESIPGPQRAAALRQQEPSLRPQHRVV